MNQYDDNTTWREATRREPCPVCEKPDWCSLTGPEGAVEAVVCMRVQSDNQRANGGWLHRMRDHGLRPLPASTNPPKPRASRKNVDVDTTVYPTDDAAVEAYRVRLGAEDRRWRYQDPAGETVLIVLRWNAASGGKKTIRPVRRTAAGWTHEQPASGRPLYRLAEVLTGDQTVYVTEGEPAADVLAALGRTVTTSSGGSGAADKTDWSPLSGRKVVLLPDNDPAGAKYRDAVLARLATLGTPPTVRVVELPGLAIKEDAEDWFDAGHTIEEFNRLVAAAAPAALPVVERPLLFKPFPVGLLPEPMGKFVVEAARAIGCEPSMVALPALAAAAGAIGATRVLRLKRTWYEPAVLWCVVVSPSGAMKSQGRKLVLAPILRRQKQELARHNEALLAHGPLQAAYEKDLGHWKKAKSSEPPPEAPERPELVELLISDTTVEAVAKALRANPRGLLLDRDELAAWFGSFDQYKSGGGDAQNWMNVHGAGFIKVNRSGAAAPLFVDRACVSVSGTIQPAILTETLTKRHRESGLAARLLIASPPRRPKRWTDEEVSEPVEAAFAERMLGLLDLPFTVDDDGEPQAVAVRLATPAQRRWKAFVNTHGEAALDRDGDELAAWSKLEGYAARLALVMALVEDPATLEVSDNTLARAIGLVEWFAHEAARFYRGTNEKAEDRELRELAEWIDAKRDGVVTPRELTQGRRELADVEAAEAAITRLIGAGYGDWRVTSTATKSRREFALATVLSPVSTSTDSPESPAPRENVDVDTRDPAENAIGTDDSGDGWEAA